MAVVLVSSYSFDLTSYAIGMALNIKEKKIHLSYGCLGSPVWGQRGASGMPRLGRGRLFFCGTLCELLGKEWHLGSSRVEVHHPKQTVAVPGEGCWAVSIRGRDEVPSCSCAGVHCPGQESSRSFEAEEELGECL